jgi:hypothetical protein
MFEFQYSEKFEPTRSAKEWWLYTHKTSTTFAGVPLPGFFQTTNYEWQVTGFFTIFLLEGLATYWSYYEGVAITAILVSIFFDIVLALVAHRFQRPIAQLKNDLVFTENTSNKAKQKILAGKKFWQNFFYLLILVSALFKLLWFFLVYQVFDATCLFVFTCYLIGAVLHIACTGYAVFTFIFFRIIKREHNQYIKSEGAEFAFNPDNPLRSRIATEMELETVVVGHHELKKDSDGKFFFFTRGVLMDKELFEMIGHQLSPEQKRTVAIEGVKQQYAILQQN